MTTYGIYFTNEYSDPGQNQDYALFCDLPKVSSNTGNPQVYSNVFLSRTLAQGAHWDISITKNYYAWCGTSPQTLAPGVTVSVGMSRLATLGTIDAPGTTFAMYDNNGAPAFKPNVTYTANPGAYEIDTGTDFTSNMNYIIGLGGPDEAGRLRPLASLAAPRNARVNIAPVTKFYLAAYSATAGTVINTSSVSKDAAAIDFTANPGMYGAIVTQQNNGKFTIKYVTQASFALAVNPLQMFQMNQLQYYIDQIQQLLNSSASTFEQRDWYSCSAAWANDPTREQKNEIVGLLRASMEALDYEYEGGGIETRLLMTMSHAQPSTLQQARLDWQNSCFELPSNLRFLIVDPQVSPVVQTDASQRVLAYKSVEANGIVGTEIDTIEAKKQRALKLLQSQGLTGALM